MHIPIRKQYSLDSFRDTRVIACDQPTPKTLMLAITEPALPVSEEELESFLRSSNLTFALEEYIRSQRSRVA